MADTAHQIIMGMLAALTAGEICPQAFPTATAQSGMREQLQQSVEFIRSEWSERPDIGIILGSGLGEYAESFTQPTIIPYADIPHFPRSTVVGHRGQLVCQRRHNLNVVVMQGRFHYYEGYTMAQVTFPVRVLALLGIQRLLVTNAAGGINPAFQAGDFMRITDHINLMGVNPLRGLHEEQFGARFPDMTEAYHRADGEMITQVAARLAIPLQQGVYVGLSGPSYETPAEIRMLQRIGGDAVGMSTVPEVIVANQMGVRVAGISCVTNLAAGLTAAKLDHQEVIETSNRVKRQFIELLDGIIAEFGRTAA